MTDERVLREAVTGVNWFLKGGDFTGQHFSRLSEITDQNVDELGLAWSTELAIPDGIGATPIVVDGVIYVSGAASVVYAVDAESGQVRWRFDPLVRRAFGEHSFLSWVARASRGLAVWDGSVFVATADCRLIALDASNGNERWSRQTCDNNFGFFITDSPYVGGGKVFLGNGGSESQEKGRGYVSAYDAKTGDLVWRFFIVPSDNPEENDTPALEMAAETWSGDTLEKHGGGGHSWNEMTYDPHSNQLFFGTSGAYPYLHIERSPAGGSNLFLSSIVAVDADTGEYRWHYQTVDRDSWDYNATMNIIVADLNIHGLDREAVMIAPKNGFHYTLDRHTGELLTVGPFAKTTWASGIDTETGVPVYDPAGEIWNVEEGETRYLWPNSWGAHGWHPMAYHPETRLTYIPVIDAPALIGGGGEENEAIVMLTEVDGQPHAPGKTVAIDPQTGQQRWRIDHDLPFNGGLLTTAGNLLFQGLGTGHFEAYSADKGDKLWSVQTGSSINAAPASYAIDGRQYVVIPVGAGGGLQYMYPEMHGSAELRGPTRLMAFSLQGREAIDLSAPPAALPDQPDDPLSLEDVAMGAALYGGYCQICHGSNAVARAGSSMPDLRFATNGVFDAWNAIVVDGLRAPAGMPAAEITAEQAQMIRSYILSRARELRRELN